MQTATDHEIDLGYLKIAGKLWGTEAGLPTLALHGYLDNANSFDMIAPQLHGLRIFAMDFAGHGFSDHRAPGALYSGLNDIRDVLAVADALGWQSFNIIGHSMGAEIGSQLAGLFPERVDRLVCIDGFCGTNSVSETLGNLRSSISSSFKAGTNLKVFPTLERMTDRLIEATGQNRQSAGCLLARGHRAVEGGFTWRTDSRIRGSGPLELTPEQLQQLVRNIQAETLFIVADRENRWLKRSLDVIDTCAPDNLTLVDLPGHHHLHMQEQAPAVVELINDFLATRTDTRQSA
ncbi:MAG: alpha/beta fold hydrolase [Pseudomonadota bacterium]